MESSTPVWAHVLSFRDEEMCCSYKPREEYGVVSATGTRVVSATEDIIVVSATEDIIVVSATEDIIVISATEDIIMVYGHRRLS